MNGTLVYPVETFKKQSKIKQTIKLKNEHSA